MPRLLRRKISRQRRTGPKTPKQAILRNKAIEKIKNQPLLYNNRGLAYLMDGKMAEALKDFETGIEYGKDEPDNYDNRAFTLMIKGDYDGAEEDLIRATGIDKEFANAYETLGFLYVLRSRYEDARKNLDKAIELDQSRALAHYLRGYVLTKQGDTAKSAADKAEGKKIDAQQGGEIQMITSALGKHYPKSDAVKLLKEIQGN